MVAATTYNSTVALDTASPLDAALVTGMPSGSPSRRAGQEQDDVILQVPGMGSAPAGSPLILVSSPGHLAKPLRVGRRPRVPCASGPLRRPKSSRSAHLPAVAAR